MGGGEKKKADALGSAPDDTALVDAPIQLHHNLARPVVVDVLELVDVTCKDNQNRESVCDTLEDTIDTKALTPGSAGDTKKLLTRG